MDQLRKILAWFKQHHFWVLSVLIVLLGPICWWIASGAMSKQYTENIGKIEGGFTNVTTVQSDPFHPNADINTRQKEEIRKQSDAVVELWKQLYKRQSEGVLKWPPQLNAEFSSTVEKLEFGAEIEDKLREHYQTYVLRHFPELPEKIGAKAIAEGQAGATGGPGFSRRGFSEDPGGAIGTAGQTEDDNNYICQWVPEDQQAVRDELEFPQTPSSLRIWCVQENLWVYHALLNVIKNTNAAANATRMSNAAVRGIYSLQVGQPAAAFSRTPNRIYKRAMATPEAEVGAETGGMPAPAGAAPEGAGAGGFTPGEFGRSGLAAGATGEMSEAQEQALLLHGRYLGPDGKPIPFGGGGGGEQPGAEPPEVSGPAGPVDRTTFGKEYVRLPVRMVLEMDQRHLPKLIAECASQSLQIEVQEVRVNVAEAGVGAGGSMPGRMNFSEGGGAGGASVIPDLAGLQEFNPQPQIATVVIQGVIYIFNKPNKELFTPPTDATADVDMP